MQPLELSIAIASDLNYLVHAATLMQSIIANNGKNRLFFHLFTMDKRVVEDKTLHSYLDLVRSEMVHCDIHFVDDNDPLIQSVPPGGTIANRSTFLRFLAANQLNTEKLLYLDCDMIVLGDLAPLFATPLGDQLFAAVPDLFGGAHVVAKGFGLQYFNAGMLLINVPLWKQQGCLEQSLQFIRGPFSRMFSGKKHCGDQDVLNMLFQGKVVYLPPWYNAVNPLFLRRSDFKGKMFEEARNNPIIVHFAGGAKPWNPSDIHSLTPAYWKYRNETPWKNRTVSPSSLLKKLIYPLKWCKYQFQRLLCPLGDLVRRIFRYPSRIICEKQIQYLIDLTEQREP